MIFDTDELKRVAHRSKAEHFALWYDEETGKFYTDDDCPEKAHYIFDIENEETPEFIAEVTNIILCDIHSGAYD